MSQDPVAPPAPPPPTNGAVHWYKSQRFIILMQSNALLILGWVIQVLSTTPTVWAWRGIVVAIATNVFLLLKDWWSPTVIAPFSALNKNNAK